jgi:hypothetical protein
MTFWQIASGDGAVDLQDIFLKLNVALIGPGNKGDFFDHRAEYEASGDWRFLHAFCEEVVVSDIFILKQWVSKRTNECDIVAVGKVVGAYRYEPIFESVDVGRWEMQHCRRVRWNRPPSPVRVTGGGTPDRFHRCAPGNPLIPEAEKILANG